MGRRAQARSLRVWMNGESVGRWTLKPNAPQEFAYDPDWLGSPAARPVSLSMPLRPPSQPYKGRRVEDFFDNLLPDSRSIRERIQRRFGTASTRAFDLLARIGRDCVGALQLTSEDDAPNVHRIDGKPLTNRGVPRELERVLRDSVGDELDSDDGDFRISALAGAQEKAALLRYNRRWMRPLGATPSTHILKLPIGTGNRGIDLSTSVENEWLCAQILRAYGLPVASCEVAQFGEYKVLVVERFDRRLRLRALAGGTWIMRLPQEDLCQATATPAALKYEADGGPGIGRIMQLLLASSNAIEDRHDFLRTQILFWMLCAIDGHAKNFSVFIEAGGRYRLTPRYDVLSAYPVLGAKANQLSPHKVSLAMAVEGNNRHYLWHSIRRSHWNETARRCGLESAEPLIEGLTEKTPAVIATAEAALPAGFPQAVAQRILAGLRAASRRLAADAKR